MKKSTVVIAGGGTGGHIIPNIVIGKIIQHHFPHLKVIHITGNRPIEIQMFESHHIKSVFRLNAKPFFGKSILRKISSLIGVAFNTLKCLGWFLRWKPVMVIGVGGYVSMGPILAAWLLRKPLLLQEQNAVPGVANRLMGRLAKKILLGFETTNYFLNNPNMKKKCVVTGNFNLAHAPDFSKPSISKSNLHLLITGGSQGAKALNEVFFYMLPKLYERFPELCVSWQCGPDWETKCRNQLSSYIQSGQLEVFGYKEKLYHDYLKANLCVARSGALTIEDIISSACPAILIPYPDATHNHQKLNAQSIASKGAAFVIDQDKKGWDKLLFETTQNLLENHLIRKSMSEKLRTLSDQHQGNKILVDLVKGFQPPS